MIEHAFESQLRYLISHFLYRRMEADKFCLKVTELWINHRDRLYEKKSEWTQPHDQLLIEEWSKSKLTNEEFQEKWTRLWELDGDNSLTDVLTSIHSACSIYNPTPEFEWEMNEDEFRSEVHKIVAKAIL